MLAVVSPHCNETRYDLLVQLEGEYGNQHFYCTLLRWNDLPHNDRVGLHFVSGCGSLGPQLYACSLLCGGEIDIKKSVVSAYVWQIS